MGLQEAEVEGGGHYQEKEMGGKVDTCSVKRALAETNF